MVPPSMRAEPGRRVRGRFRGAAGFFCRRRERRCLGTATATLEPRLSGHASARSHTWSTERLRHGFYEFFEGRGHERLPSSSLVPTADSTLLFTNAGMVQFKDWFCDTELATVRRAVTVQRCMRAGGKHNDLDNVGRTARHHTLFEMLGSFAFSDAGDAERAAAAAASGAPAPLKAEAIVNAWEFLTQHVQLPPSRLSVTVHEADEDAATIWRDVVGLSAEQIVRGREDNWWSMGAGAGPVGPCTEIFWDQQKEVDGERWLELWNLVFMEHMRAADGGLSPLPRPCIDTGMGLERLASVLQEVPTNYHTDGFEPLFHRLATLAPAGGDVDRWRCGTEPTAVAARVVVDHLRAVCFLLCDGVVPSNVGRGYTFRRVLRRAVRHGATLGFDRPFLAQLLPALADCGGDWPHVDQRLGQVASIVEQEEELFLRTMCRGLELLNLELAEMEQKQSDDAASGGSDAELSAARTLGADATFRLYDTYGFPFDLTTTIAAERGYAVDLQGAEALMTAQRARARAAGLGTAASLEPAEESGAATAIPTTVPADLVTMWQRSGVQSQFTGYDTLTEASVRVVASAVDAGGDSAWIVLERCPFYPTSGGQLGDSGILAQLPSAPFNDQTAKNATQQRQCKVVATIKACDGVIACRVVAQPTIGGQDVESWLPATGEAVGATACQVHRRGCESHHTATHMLAAALRAVLPTSTSLVQAGSSVEPRRLRYDCSGVGNMALSQVELDKASALVNASIRHGIAVATAQLPTELAVASGAIADFGEKYGDIARVVTIGSGAGAESSGFLTQLQTAHPPRCEQITAETAKRFLGLLHAGELCGGTHVSSTADLFAFQIVRESGIGAGTRRIEAVVGEAA